MRIAKMCLVLAVSTGMIFTFIPNVCADEASELILKLLIKKGIISQDEVDDLKAEIKRAKEKKVAEAPKDIEERVTKLEKSVPKWVKSMKVKGDLRLRQEDIYNEGSNTHRQRLRFRVGVSSKLNEKLKVGFGLASGSSDSPTSTNQTLEQEFQSKNIWLDYAYAKYDPFDWLYVIGGKFKSPFTHTDMLWDTDIRWDGVAAGVTIPVFDEHGDFPETDLHLLGGYFPLDDRVGNSEPNLLVVQVVDKTKFDDVAKLDAAIAVYYIEGMEGYTGFAESRGTNTRMAGGIAHNFHTYSPYAKLTFLDPMGIGVPVAVFGEFAHNLAAGDDDVAYRLGVQLGKKPKKKNDWRLIGQYSEVEQDVFYDGFPDADFNSGGTNAKGLEAIFEYALWKNVILGFDYYYTESINGAEASQHTLQSDVIFKF